VTLALFFTILGSLVVAAIGAFVAAIFAHRYTSQRDQANRRNDLRVEYLLTAYRSISDAISRTHYPDSPDARALEKGLSDIQLLGSGRQVGMVLEVIQEITSNGEVEPDGLLRSLRDELRDELGLEPVSNKPIQLRVVAKPPDPV
jgi:type II secretory pathway pseudopilin PulG